jgi:hypothetical protein
MVALAGASSRPSGRRSFFGKIATVTLLMIAAAIVGAALGAEDLALAFDRALNLDSAGTPQMAADGGIGIHSGPPLGCGAS